MDRQQLRFITLVGMGVVLILILDRFGVFAGEFTISLPQIAILAAVILGIAYLLFKRKPAEKQPLDSLYCFSLWLKNTPSGRKVTVPLSQIDWSRITRTLYPYKWEYRGSLPFGSSASPEWRDFLLMLDPYMDKADERHTNEIYFGEDEPRKIREKVRKGETPLTPVEQLAMKEVEKEKIKEQVEETKEGLE